MRKIGKDTAWLFAELRRMGYDDRDRLAYVEWEKEEGLFVLEHDEE